MGRSKSSTILKLCSGIIGAVLGGLYGRHIFLLFILEPPPEGKSFSVWGAIIGFIVLYYVVWMPYSPFSPDRWLGRWLYAKLKARPSDKAKEIERKE